MQRIFLLRPEVGAYKECICLRNEEQLLDNAKADDVAAVLETQSRLYLSAVQHAILISLSLKKLAVFR